jgi:hypothetical protein
LEFASDSVVGTAVIMAFDVAPMLIPADRLLEPVVKLVSKPIINITKSIVPKAISKLTSVSSKIFGKVAGKSAAKMEEKLASTVVNDLGDNLIKIEAGTGASISGNFDPFLKVNIPELEKNEIQKTFMEVVSNGRDRKSVV